MIITFERSPREKDGTKNQKRKGTKKPPREKRNFSKVILAAVMVLYFLGAFFGGYIVFTTGFGLEALLGYIGAPTATAIGFYAWKAKNENCKKIGGNYAESITGTNIPAGVPANNEDLRG